MLTQIIAPEPYFKPFHLFLAGGISGCPDWQSKAFKLLECCVWIRHPLVILNPRREDFDISNPEESERQIQWEHAMLMSADGIFFWFPKETLCPITLFELGKMASSGKPLFVGCDPGYARKKDVEIQLGLLREDTPVYDSLEKTIGSVLSYLMQQFQTHSLQYKGVTRGTPNESGTRGSAD